MEVRFGKCQEVRKSSGMSQDSENGAMAAMAIQTSAAEIALIAREIDLARYAMPDKRRTGGRNNAAHKFMTGNAGKVVIASKQLQVCVADSGQQNLNECVASYWIRPGDILQEDAAGSKMYSANS